MLERGHTAKKTKKHQKRAHHDIYYPVYLWLLLGRGGFGRISSGFEMESAKGRSGSGDKVVRGSRRLGGARLRIDGHPGARARGGAVAVR